jgi:hypothetical protein
VSKIAEYGPPIDGADNGDVPGVASEESLRMRRSIGKKLHFQMGKKSLVGVIRHYEPKYHSVSVEVADGGDRKMMVYVKLGRVTSYGVEE